MEKIAEGICKITYQKPEPFTPVSMRKSEMADDTLKRIGNERKDGATAQPFEETEIQFEQTVRGITVRFPMKTDEDIYGFGLQLLSLNAAGRKRYVKVNSDPRMERREML